MKLITRKDTALNHFTRQFVAEAALLMDRINSVYPFYHGPFSAALRPPWKIRYGA